jgi:hypothetical protein
MYQMVHQYPDKIAKDIDVDRNNIVDHVDRDVDG